MEALLVDMCPLPHLGLNLLKGSLQCTGQGLSKMLHDTCAANWSVNLNQAGTRTAQCSHVLCAMQMYFNGDSDTLIHV